MPPSAIIDSDLDPNDNTILYVAELDAIWKGTALGGGNTVWAQVYDVANFDPALGSGLVIDRVRCSKTVNNVLSIGHALGTDAATYYEFCGVSSNGGMTWSWYQIGEIEDPLEGFTLGSISGEEHDTTTTFSGGGGSVVCSVTFGTVLWHYTTKKIEVIFPASLIDPIDDYRTLEYDCLGEFPSREWSTTGDAAPFFDYLTYSPFVEGTFTPITGGYHFSGHLHPSGMVDPTILHLGWHGDYTGRWLGTTAITRTGTFCNLVIDGVEYGSGVSRAFDVAPMTPTWLYYGATDRIWKSEDGGVTWAILLEDTGAYDICVDPQASGAFYFWNIDGNLDLAVEDVVTSTGLMTESALNVPLRIARDVNSGRLLALPNGTTLTMRNLGSNTDLKTGLTGATGLHCYLGQKIIFLDTANIWISDDIQAATPTITAKKGGWSEYAGPVNAHRMIAP